MPYLRLELSSDVAIDEAQPVLSACARTIVDALEVKVGSLRLRLDIVEPEDYFIVDVADAHAPVNGKAMGTWVCAHVAFLEGRSDEKKIRLIEDLTRVLSEQLQVPVADVRVLIVEYPKAQWGIAGKTALAAGR